MVAFRGHHAFFMNAKRGGLGRPPRGRKETLRPRDCPAFARSVRPKSAFDQHVLPDPFDGHLLEVQRLAERPPGRPFER